MICQAYTPIACWSDMEGSTLQQERCARGAGNLVGWIAQHACAYMALHSCAGCGQARLVHACVNRHTRPAACPRSKLPSHNLGATEAARLLPLCAHHTPKNAAAPTAGSAGSAAVSPRCASPAPCMLMQACKQRVLQHSRAGMLVQADLVPATAAAAVAPGHAWQQRGLCGLHHRGCVQSALLPSRQPLSPCPSIACLGSEHLSTA